MRRAALLTALIVFVFLAGAGCRRGGWNAREVTAVLDTLEQRLDWLDYRLAREEWDFYTQGKADSLEFYRGLYNYVITDPRAYDAIQHGAELFSDETDLRRLRVLRSAVLLGRVESYPAISRVRDSLSAIDIRYRGEFEGEPRTAAYLNQIYRTDPDPKRRERSYSASLSVGAELADGLELLFRLRNQEARKYGYNSYLSMVFNQSGIDMEDYLALLKRLEEASNRPYQEILESMTRRLEMNQLEVWDLSYAYSDVNRQVDAFFPADSQLPYIDAGLSAIGIELNKLPIYYDLLPRGGKSQFAYGFTIKAPYDMRVLANLNDGIYSAFLLTHEIGHALNSAYIRQDRAVFRNNLDGCWSEAIAQIFASVTGDRRWLEKYARMPADLITRYLEAKRQQDVIYLRTTLMRLHFEFEAYMNPRRDLNRLYWDLFEKYLMLPRHEETKPWAAVVHYVTHPVYIQNYLYADLITAQTLAFLQKNYGGLVDSPRAGTLLKNDFMQYGGRYDWRELLKRTTDEDLNPNYFLGRMGL